MQLFLGQRALAPSPLGHPNAAALLWRIFSLGRKALFIFFPPITLSSVESSALAFLKLK